MTVLETPNDHRTLLNKLLEEQQELSAVDRFARLYARAPAPAQEQYYRELLPLSAPAAGQQYAFEVDLDRCSGCKACVTACHALNGLDDDESWREVGLLHSDDWRAPFQATVTTACHHCVDPACLNGCPVLAYDKDPITGIVRHLDDQCIGCQYCIMKCPYEVPNYSAKRGIVRKCDMCSSRLAQGEAPACVQACPSQAIRITVVDQGELSARFRGTAGTIALAAPSNPFLPASPSPDCTVPTTRYVSSRPLPANVLAGDHAHAVPAAAHPPLVFMLVLSQLAVGLSVAAVFNGPAKWLSTGTVFVGAVALIVGTLHLGQPLKAWRAFLGWRTSWFSREVIAFGLFIFLAMISAVLSWWPAGLFHVPLAIITALAAATALVGLLGVACSAMIYADTAREFWRISQSLGKFFGTVVVLGAAALLAADTGPQTALIALLVAGTAAKLILEQRLFRHLVDEETPAPAPLNKTARLLAGELGGFQRARLLCGLVGGIVLPLLLALLPGGPFALPAFVLCLAGELLERHLFFIAVAPAKMPGPLAA